MQFGTFSNCLSKELSAKSIPTGCKHLDKTLNGGIRMGTVTEISGNSGSGKTQLSLQLAINSVLPSPLGTISGHVLWISTKRSIFPQRVEHLVDNYVNIWQCQETKMFDKKRVTKEVLLKKIHHVLALDLVKFIAAVYQLKSFIENNPETVSEPLRSFVKLRWQVFFPQVRLIVIDSFSTFFRDLEPSNRIRVMYELLFVLENITDNEECAVVLVNEFATQITYSDSSPDKPALGDAFHHRVQHRIVLGQADDRKSFFAQIRKNLFSGPSLVKFQITKNGVCDLW